MGGSQSTTQASLSSNTTVVNQSALNLLSSTANTNTINNMINAAKNCSSTISQGQNINLGDITVGGQSSATITQQQAASLDFTCLQQNTVQNQIIQQLASSLTQAFQNNSSSDLLNKLNSAIKQKSQSESIGFPWGGSSTNTSVNQKINNYIANKTTTNLSDVVNNATYANFQTSTIDTCLAQIIQNQQIAAGNVTVTGKSQFAITQSQNVAALTKCIQTADIASKVVSDVTKYAGLTLSVKNDAAASNTSETSAESSTQQIGLFGGISKVVDSLGGLVQNLFTGIGLGILAPLAPSLVSCCCCLCCLIILFVIFGGMGIMGSSSDVTTTDYA